jgi:hypothetical protein
MRGGDEVHVPHDPALDQLAHGIDGGAVHEGVPGHQYALRFPREVRQLVRLLQARGQRLLHQHVAPRFQHLSR